MQERTYKPDGAEHSISIGIARLDKRRPLHEGVD